MRIMYIAVSRGIFMANLNFRKKLLGLALDVSSSSVKVEVVDERELIAINTLRNDIGVVKDVVNDFRGEVEDIVSFWVTSSVKMLETPFGKEKYVEPKITGICPTSHKSKYTHVLGVRTAKEGMTHYINYEIKKRKEKRKQLNKTVFDKGADKKEVDV